MRFGMQCIVVALLLGCKSDKDVSRILTGKTMGTSWSVVIAEKVSDESASRLQGAIENELLRINALMSTYDPDSELSRFNANQTTDPIALHPDTLNVLDSAIEISDFTNGAYDVTLGPVIDLWGFGARDEHSPIPDKNTVAKKLEITGYQKLRRNGSELAKQDPLMRVDLSSIAKGFAVDQLGLLVEQTGVKHFTAEIGGELLTRGRRANGSKWRIGIEQPAKRNSTDTPLGIAVERSHMASSGDYRQYREVGGVRYSHLIDGTTGYPVTHKVAAVTVLHDSAMLADGWATALMVLPLVEGVALADRLGIAAQFTYRTDQTFRTRRTKAFPPLIE